MPTATDGCRVDGAHVVQFYDSDEQLVAVAGSYLSDSVRAGEAAVTIATPAHRRSFLAALAASGIDVEEAVAAGQLVTRDAAVLLACCKPDGRLDRVAFDESVGSVLRGAAAGGRPVRAYGEMIALLWGAGDAAGAIELEDLWNDLAARLPFSLFCAYPSAQFASPGSAEAFAAVCHSHSDVVAGPPVPSGARVARHFAPGPNALRLARRFVVDILGQWRCSDVAEEAIIVVGELTANALLHARSAFTVALSRHGRTVRIAVGDTDRAAPAPREASMTASYGRGLRMVGQLARRWGHEVTDGGKVVWAELDVGTPPA